MNIGESSASIGQQLKSAREKLSIDERSASERTHIRQNYIIAMENDDFDSIDLAPVYRIGFLRIYAKLLKLDADAIVAQFKETQNAKPSGTRGKFLIPVSKPTESNGSDDSGFGTSFGSGNNPESGKIPRIAVVIAVAVLVLLGLSLFVLKSCGGSDAVSEAGTSVAVAQTPEDRIAYEIEIVSTASQKVTIRENYKDWDRQRREPIAGATILDEYVPAGKTKKLIAHGTLFIREETLKGCKIKYPSANAFKNVGTSNKIMLDAAPRQINGTNSTSWLIEPWK